MKNYALYLLILCFSVIGCQKDIGESDAEIKLKKKSSRVIYLPIRIDQISSNDTIKFYFEYENDEGDLKSHYSVPRNSDYTYQYTNGKFTQWYISTARQQQTLGDAFTTFFYSNNKYTGSASYQWEGTPKPGSIPDQNGEYPESDIIWTLAKNDSASFTWSGDRMITKKNRSGCYKYEYDQDNLMLDHNFNFSDNPNDYFDQRYTHNDKNYWAKDIRNKNLFIPLPVATGPFQKDLTKIESIYSVGNSVRRSYTEMKSKYNEDCYPVETIQTFNGTYGDGSPFVYTLKYLFYYRKVELVD